MNSVNGNGFRIKGWRDLLTVASLFILGTSLIASAVVWGVLIDLKSQSNSDRITRLETLTGAEERAIKRRIEALEQNRE